MLAEKFLLLLETLKSNTYPDGSPRGEEHVAARRSAAKSHVTDRLHQPFGPAESRRLRGHTVLDLCAAR